MNKISFRKCFQWAATCYLCLTILNCAAQRYMPNQDPEIDNLKASMSSEDAVRILNAGHIFIYLSDDNRIYGSTEGTDLTFAFTEQGLSYPVFLTNWTTQEKRLKSSGSTYNTYEIWEIPHSAPCSVSFQFTEIKRILVKKDMNLDFRSIVGITLISDRWPGNDSYFKGRFSIRVLGKDSKRVLAALEKLCPNLNVAKNNKAKDGTNHARSAVRLKLSDQDDLAEIAKNDKDGNMRLAAAAKLNDKSLAQSIYANIAKYDKDGAVRLAAVKKLADKELLANLAKYAKDSAVRLAAERKLEESKLN
jgi:hypothetical protein